MNREFNSRSLSPIALIWFVFALLTYGSAIADSSGYLEDKTLISELRKGGFNIYFRHEATDWSQDDHVSKADDWLSCDGSRIRQLSETGRKNAIATGNAIRSLGIPIGKILASPYCRTMDTARLMGLGEVKATNDVINLRIAEYFGGRSAIVETARRLLSTIPPPGTNNIIVAHGNVARNATPVYPGEGEGVIFQPDNKGGFKALGRLTPEDWARIARSPLE